MSDGPNAVIAIDGPAASGKSSVARELADRLSWGFVNTGAMYRAVTWHLLRKGVDLQDEAAVLAAVDAMKFECEIEDRRSVIRIDGDQPDAELTSLDVTGNVSAVASIAQVRELLVAKQRTLIELGHLVMEGRDIGTSVFPWTPYKFYVDAAPDIRAQRRRSQGLTDEVAHRDRLDSSRKASPLSIAPGANVIDSSEMTVAQVVDEIIRRAAALGLEIPGELP